jgi:hypothetical protein
MSATPNSITNGTPTINSITIRTFIVRSRCTRYDDYSSNWRLNSIPVHRLRHFAPIYVILTFFGLAERRVGSARRNTLTIL